jgi:hypothetical protein
MKSKLFVFVLFFLCVVSFSQMLSENKVFAQYVDTAWVRRYNGPNGWDYARAITVDDSGNVYVTGDSDSSGTYQDYLTIKYNLNGGITWMKRYNGLGNSGDGALDIAVDGSGNVYLTGYSYSYGSNSDYCTIKYYPNGDTAWIRRYDGPGSGLSWAYALVIDDSNTVYVTGGSFGTGTNRDYATVKYDSTGDTAWVRRYNGPANGDDDARAIGVDDSGNVYVTGGSLGSGTNEDYTTIKYYSTGDTAWVRRYSGTGYWPDRARAIALDGSDNVYVTGCSGENGDYLTIKYYSNGDTAWVRYGVPGNGACAIAVDGMENVYVTGLNGTIKYDPNGNQLWIGLWGGCDIALDMSNNIYVTGESAGDYITIKYYSNGDTAWVRQYNGLGNGNDYAGAIAVDDSGNVYVTGNSWGSGTYDDYATIKYIQYDSIPFAPAVNYGAGNQPISVFCADLDGDLDVDLATVNQNSDSVSILKNNGDGTFQTKVDYGAGIYPYSVFCADLDGDADLDLAVTDLASQNVSILKNNGDGTFQTKVDYGTGGSAISVFCADLDGDNDLDLAAANQGSDNVSILKNNGDGTFQGAVTYGAGDSPYSVFCADLDGDYDLDLAVANQGSDNVSILKNNGDGTFQTKVDYGAGDAPWSLFCADLDGDTDLDLAVVNQYSENVSILKNNGDGTFETAVNYGATDYPVSVFCADLDGDLDLDLAVANWGSYNVSILKNNGDGTFETELHYGAGTSPRAVFCSDLDGDSDFDVAVANAIGDSVSILKNLTQVPANQPPWAFSLMSPEDQDTIFGSATFQWQTPYDPNFGDQLRYELYISTSLGFEPGNTTIDSNLCISKHTKAMDPGTYYWKVKARDNWGAERWSTETWSLVSRYLTDTLTIIAFSPVDLIVTDPIGDSIGIAFNTIPNADYDTTTDYDHDGDKDDIVTIPDRLVGNYLIEVVAEPGDTGVYDLGIRIDGTNLVLLTTDQPSPSPGEPDTFTYNAPWYVRGDANGDWKITASDVVYLINYLYIAGPAPEPLETGDVNCDGMINAADIVYLINYLYIGGPPPSC